MTDVVSELRLVLTVGDFDRAVAFYRDALGLVQEADWSSPDGRVTVLSAGRATIEIVDANQADYIDRVEVGRRVAGPVRVALHVADSGAVAQKLHEAGAEILAPATLTPWNDLNARVNPPDGVQLTLFTPGRGD